MDIEDGLSDKAQMESEMISGVLEVLS